MSIENDMEILKNLERIFMMKRVDILAIRDIDPEKFGLDNKFLIKKNSKFSAPLSTAIKLVKEGYATVPEEYINWIKKIIWKEKSRTRQDILVKHEDDFYQKLVITIYAIKHDKQNIKMDEGYRSNLMHLTKQVLHKRLQTILLRALHDSKSTIKNTAPEENLLMRIIKNIVETWMESLNINEF